MQINIIIMIISLVRIYQSRKVHAEMTGSEKATRDTAKYYKMCIILHKYHTIIQLFWQEVCSTIVGF